MASDLLDPLTFMVLDLSWGTVCGLYALHYLARSTAPVTAQQIASHGQMSSTFLAKTLQSLRREGLVRGQRGRGYRLSRPSAEISVLEVIRALEGPIQPATLCLMKNDNCVFQGACPLARLCRELSSSVMDALGSVTLASLPVDGTGFPVCMARKRDVAP
ncbi:MAG: Rrf2 family transcriptional regulator [Planctomycetes bacterium]|nr:Rrf2 family transcriptional regulator [Planctomycetota bacterium]